MPSRKRAALALLTAALLSLGACEDQDRESVDEPTGDVEQAPGEELPEAEATDEPEE